MQDNYSNLLTLSRIHYAFVYVGNSQNKSPPPQVQRKLAINRLTRARVPVVNWHTLFFTEWSGSLFFSLFFSLCANSLSKSSHRIITSILARVNTEKCPNLKTCAAPKMILEPDFSSMRPFKRRPLTKVRASAELDRKTASMVVKG